MFSSTRSVVQDFGALRERYVQADQAQVFRHWDRLDRAGRQRLAAQAASLDLSAAAEGRARIASGPEPPPDLEPALVARLPEQGGDAVLRARARARGEEMLAAGAVAPLVVAGGQATRLGWDGPKGCFPIGPVSERSLFELLAQKLRAARRRSGRPLPWCVMTSESTDTAIRAFFRDHDFFGLPEPDVLFFCQASTPALDHRGRILLEAPDRIAVCPGGHGGVIPALLESGVLDRLEERGIRWITTFQVDNPLVHVADPVFLGLHALANAEMSCKVVAKRSPRERAGSVALRDGRVRVIEYSEIAPAHRDLRGDDGELRFWAASIGMHVLDTGFVRRAAARAAETLPHHLALKRIPCLAEDGSHIRPTEPNAYKLERFVFDALAATDRAALLEVRREEEYSPVKNPDGSESPATARRDLVACYERWLARADANDPAKISGPEAAAILELDPHAPGPEVSRTASGVSA